MSIILQIAIPGPLRNTFNYFSEDKESHWEVGSRVQVPFGHRNLVGFIVSINEAITEQTLKPITKQIDSNSLLPQDIYNLIIWSSQYYHHPIGDCFQVALPKKIRLGDEVKLTHLPHWSLTEINSENKLGKKQIAIVDYLSEHQGEVSQSTLYSALGPCRDALLRLEKKGVIQCHERLISSATKLDKNPLKKLKSEQLHSVETIWSNKEEFSSYLLHGITGSGKTEVYLELAARLVKEKKQVLILIPEIGLTDQFVHRFQQHLSANIVIFHSGMTDTERMQAWLLAKEGHADIVIGTRSSVFIPMPNLGLIVIDEEHDSAYKQQDSLRYHARQVALIRAKERQVPIVLGSATPSLESYYHAQAGRYHLLTLTERATGASLPEVSLIDSRGPQHTASGLSSALFKEVERELSKDNQVLLFINQRGFAPVLLCHECQWQAVCPDCDAKLIVHQSRYQLRCHHCGYNQSLIQSCPDCESTALGHYGLGTEQVEQSLKSLFPSTPIFRIDRDSTQRVGAFSELRDKINEGGQGILIGTQMLAKGHDFHDVTLVGVLDADQGLFSADYRATEVLAQLIIQVMGRAGRGKKSGRVSIQTHQPDHPFWQQVLEQGYKSIAEHLLAEREAGHMPPVGSLCLIRARGKQTADSMTFLSEVAALLNQTQQQDVMMMGPVPAVMEKRAGYFRAQLLLMTSQRKRLHQLLDHHMSAISALKSSRKVKWSIDIDPIDLM